MGITLFLVAVVIGIVGRVSPRIAVGITGSADPDHRRRHLHAGPAPPSSICCRSCWAALAGIYFLVTVFRRQLVPASRIRSTTDPAGRSTRHRRARRRAVDRRRTPRPARPGPRIRWPRRPPPPSNAATRRQFFKIAGIGAVVAVAAGALAKWIPSTAEVAASRSSVALPTPADVQTVRRRRPRGRRHHPVRHQQRRLLPGRHRLRGAPGDHRHLAAADPRHGRQRDHPQLRRSDRHAVHRADGHPDLRLQRGRRRPGRQRHAGRASGSPTC